MHTTEIAIVKPFEGAPKINLADLFGASPGKPVILRVPVSGERPVEITAQGLPQGLTLRDGIVTGCVEQAGDYTVRFTARNRLGRAEKRVTFEIGEGTLLPTPLLGFASYNAFGADVTQEQMIDTAERMVRSGISEFGYSYVNTDSGWQCCYGGKYDAIQPNKKFPDMAQMCDRIHALGLKAGIYSTPMLTAWGCPKEFKSIPGCTVGDPDPRYPDTNGGIGVVHKEQNNVRQWEDWGFDYLKYDWTPCDPENAELMRRCLASAKRDFAFCVTVHALPEFHEYYENNCCSYRCNSDSDGKFGTILGVYRGYTERPNPIRKGHFYDWDMLDTGWIVWGSSLSEDEQIAVFSLRAFFSSPLQISTRLDKVSEFELSLYCNDEILAVNQDCAFAVPVLCQSIDEGDRRLVVYKKALADGSTALGAFNLGETEEKVDEATNGARVRDLWAKKDLAGDLSFSMPPHTARIFKIG